MSDARVCCLEARTQQDLDAAEFFFKQFLAEHAQLCGREKRKKKKSLRIEGENPAGNAENLLNAREWLAMLLLQAGRSGEATPYLQELGYIVRLADGVLNYQFSPGSAKAKFSCSMNSIANKQIAVPKVPCAVVDNALPAPVWEALRGALGSLQADYWALHDYSIEPPSPYFSYIVPLADNKSSALGILGVLIRAVMGVARRHFGDIVNAAQFAEIWAHNRPHGSGHQLHFDSDDEGRGGIRHPIVSSAFFLQGNVGGPTLVSTQRLGDRILGESCWLCPPQANRLVVFDGSVLHGVVPGRGVTAIPGERRVTIMVALWANIAIREDPGKGSARRFPSGEGAPQWVADLTKPTSGAGKQNSCDAILRDATFVEPQAVGRLWERINGDEWPRDTPIPPYDKVFQGF